MFGRRAKPEKPRPEECILERLRQENDFMRAIDLTRTCGLRPKDTIIGLDHLYSSGLIMARFILHDKAIIVTVDEVRSPEIGFSRQLDVLLVGIGINRGNWAEIPKDYAAFPQGDDFGGLVPDGVGPLEVFRFEVVSD